MFTTKRSQLQHRTHQAQQGQSIVVALLVLLLLGLAGALFVTIIARNLINARHANRVVTADAYAHAGIAYADAQLSNSVDGADWRPTLQFALSDGTNGIPDNRPGTGPVGTAASAADSRERKRYKAAVLSAVNPNDPDLEYLQAGYTRYNTGAGRYLLRVSYDPVNVTGATVPPGKYLKIESIGREGAIDTMDPTTYTNNRSTDRTQAYQVAYKPIGITDYARFETNPDKRSDIANLGVISEFYAANTDGGIATPGVFDFSNSGSQSTPSIQEYPVLTTYGAADAYIGNGASLQPNPNAGKLTAVGTGFTPGGGSIHANMSVRFFGMNVMYLNPNSPNSPLFQDSAEIAGDLLLDSYNDSIALKNPTLPTPTAGQQAAIILNPTDIANLGSTNIANYVSPSNSSGTVNKSFDTHNGLVRDSSMQNDAAGLPREITRLEPPLMDAQDSASQLPRYRAVAMNSAPRGNLTNPDGTTFVQGSGQSPSQYGYGKAIYVNNPQDVQPDSASIGGGTTLTDEWLHGNNAANGTGLSKGNWNGLFYSPPGVSIVLGQFIPVASGGGPSGGAFGIRLIRSAGDHFVGPDGTTNAGPEMDVSYSDLDRDANNVDRDTTDPAGALSDKDIVIYAEGNVRVRGIVSPNEGSGSSTLLIPRHITIVTNGTAYIEGNLLKGSPDSSISVLAHDYVCVNTTQFLAGSNVEDRTDGSQNPVAPTFGDTLSLDAGHSLLQEFNFGLTGTDTPASKYGAKNLALYVAAGPAGSGATTADFDILGTNNASIFPTPLPPLSLNTFTHLTYDLSGTNSSVLLSALGTDLFHFSAMKSNGAEDTTGVISLTDQDVSLERVAILPMDIRIEAVLYAQTRSFFVIPGEWFNTNSGDNLTNYINNATRPDNEIVGGLSAADIESRSRFPMYGQPIDLKITIDGSVSEARPADIAAQSAWMQKWGWIPQYHGNLVSGDPNVSTPENAGHQLSGLPAIGLQIIYDPQTGYPYDPTAVAVANRYYLRSDQYGRPLPFTPKLPVSTGLLYSGESGEAPLLQ